MKIKSKLIVILAVILSACLLLGLSACGAPLKLSAPKNITYDGEMFRWDKVDNAQGYIVKINDGAEFSVPTNEFGYNAGQQTVTIMVKGTAKAKDVEAEKSTKTFTYLGKVDDSTITITDDGQISWPAIAGATGYEVKDNMTGIVTPIYTTVYNLPVGRTKFRVRPIVSGDTTKYSTWSNERDLTKCAQPDASKIYYDGTYISYDAINGANKYQISINGLIQDELVSGCKFAYEAGNTDFTVRIKPIGNHSQSFDGEESLEKKFVFLPLVTGLKIQEGEIRWNGDSSKTYLLNINGNETTVTGSSYSGDLLKTDRSMEIKIKEISKDATYFSHYTLPITVKILPAPVLQWSQSLALDGYQNNLSWETIDGASGYTVTITRPDGENDEFTFSSDIMSFGEEYGYEEVGTYKVTVKANAQENEGTVSSSKESEVFTVVRPAAPERRLEDFIVSNDKALADGFTVTCKDANLGYRYKLYKNGTQDGEVSDTPTFRRQNLISEDTISAQEDTYEIQVVGKINSPNRVTLNSKDRLSFKITILAMPQNVRMNGFKLEYDDVAGAQNNYWITGVAGGNGISGLSGGVSLDDYVEVGSYDMQVCARGNGAEVLASNYSPVVRIFRLAAPTNIKIDTAVAGNGILKYDADLQSSVEIYLDRGTAPVQNTDVVLENMNDYIKETGTYVSIVAVANELRADGVYYMSSRRSEQKEFVKIKAPTNLSFTNTHLTWNQEGISEDQVGQMTYDVYNSINEVRFSPSLSARECDISMLEGGYEYTFHIRAIGDGERYINSDISESETVYKLRSPSVKKVDGGYQWNAIANTSSYAVTVDGKPFDTAIHQAGETYTFNPISAFEQVKTYKVVVTAVGNGGIGSLKTISSAPVVIEQKVVQLNKPEFSVSYEGETFDPFKNIVVTVTKEVPFSAGYRYSVNGKTEDKTGENNTVYYYNAQNAGIEPFKVSVQALGGNFNDQGEFMIISQFPTAKDIYLLPAPSKDSIDLTADGIIKWGAIQPANGYEIVVILNGGASVTLSSTSSQCDLSYYIDEGLFDGITRYKDVVSVKVEIRAISKVDNKVNSITVEKEWVNVH